MQAHCGLRSLRRHFSPLGLAVVAFLAAWSPCLAQQVTFTPYNQNGIYDLGEKAGWTITLPEGSAAPSGKYTYTVRRNNLDVIKTGELDLSSGKATLEVPSDEPAMLHIQVTPPGGGQQGGGAVRPRGGSGLTAGAAIAPTRLQPSVPRPADFDSFWEGKLKALSEVPINPELTPTQTNRTGVELYTVKLDSLNSHVQGYLAKPARAGKFPALVIYQWAGVYALQTNTSVDRAVEGWLAFNVDSHDLPPDQATGVPSNYQTIGNTDRETSYFLNMYLRDARAIDYMLSRPDWDGKTIVVTGTSMGGQQSLVTAGLRAQVTALVVNEPAGADSNGDLHGRRAGYPNWPSSNPKVMETALYFDTVNFAPRIKGTAVIAIGFIDTIAPPVGIWTVYNQIPGPKEVIPMVESDHNNITPNKQGAWDSRSKEVLNLKLKGQEFTPGGVPRP
jgi:cephalosporin-C deacetylase